ncbi:unnamed protein product [marine sediment metagenome]|uniref:HTH arsR-type domain-containing protein n=1 Tax=marine sediment metagenome TaxID=412755 RepID=X1R9T0_9ZZZZ
MGQVEVIEALKEHGELSIKEMDELIDDMSLPAIRNALHRLSHAGELEKRVVKRESSGVYYKYRLKAREGA